jgi:thiamine biosynthesis lipoprotein
VQTSELQLEPRDNGIVAVTFRAMASPCEVLLDTDDLDLAQQLGRAAAAEAWRIEAKYSRYLPDSLVNAINRSQGRPITVDAETAALLDYAAECYRLSAGKFDITSGILRRCWKFDGSDRVPDPPAVSSLLPFIGFKKLNWQRPQISLPPGMEIDFGGFGKEYAVDRALALVTASHPVAALANFGGDLAANSPNRTGPWQVAVERPDTEREPRLLLELAQGALATSGDSHRFLLRDGVRYSHILDVHDGWPVRGVPRSVSVVASSCVAAGMLATLAMLNGTSAEAFLDSQEVRYWCLR